MAAAFPSPLIVDTQSFNPRGTAFEQIDRILADVAALAAAGELSTSDAKNLLDQLTFARSALQRERLRVAVLSLKAFQLQVATLAFRQRLDLDIALSLGFAAGALEQSLDPGK